MRFAVRVLSHFFEVAEVNRWSRRLGGVAPELVTVSKEALAAYGGQGGQVETRVGGGGLTRCQ